MKPGEVMVTPTHLFCTAYNDLIWETVWKNYLASERRKALTFLYDLVAKTRNELGLTGIPPTPQTPASWL